MTEKAKHLVRIASAIIFGNKTSDNRTPSTLRKEIKRDAGQISAIVNVLPSKEIQLFLEFFPKRVNGTTATISLTVQSVDEAKKFIGQIEDSFNCWNADDCEKVIIRA